MRRRGFVHVLLLVFAVLGITMWGMSELFQRHLEQKNTVERKSNTALEAARDALFDYALTPPAKVEGRALPGLYNAYSQPNIALIPRFNSADFATFRRFSLPCPDVAGGDNDLDGVSDILQDRCFGGSVAPLASHSRFGRLPWRDLNHDVSGVYTYIRGVGDRDYRDGYGERFWYALSDNVTDTSLPLNPHSLIRMTTGWLTAKDEVGEVLSDRVAAVVVAPGIYGDGNTGRRIDEETLYGGDGTTPGVVDGATYPSFHESYLESDAYADFVAGTEDFTVRNLSGESFADQIEYLTIDELASDSGRGIEALESGEENLYDLVAGDENFLGVPEMLSEHLQRFGYLPDPAAFDESAVTVRHRSSGFPAQASIVVSVSLTVNVSMSLSITPGTPPTTVTTDITTVVGLTATLEVQHGAIVNVNGVTALLSMRIGDLPPFYLLPGSQIVSEARDNFFAPSFPPYNIPLFDLETRLNERPLDAAEVAALTGDGHYPTEDLFGIQGAYFDADESNVRFSDFLSHPSPTTVGVKSDLPIMLAAPAYAYFQSGDLVSLISHVGDGRTGIGDLPPYSAKVLLPAGTRLTLEVRGFDVELRLPAKYAVDEATYDPITGVWSFQDSSDQVVEIVRDEDNADELIGVTNVPNNWPVIVGDSGFLPVEGVNENMVYVYPASNGARVSLAGDENAISDLSMDMRLYTEATLTIIPFPPPGRPALRPGDITPLPSPVLIPPNSEFDLPVGGRVIYPSDSRFNIGDSFVFPDDSVVRFPDGAVLDVSLPPDGVLSDGYQPGNTVALEGFKVTLLNGGFVSLRDTRPVIGDAAVFGAQQRVFDIELRGPASFSDNNLFALPLSRPMDAGQVFQPFTGKSFERAPVIQLGDGDVLSSNSRVRAKFLTAPRLFYQHDTIDLLPRGGEIEFVGSPIGLSTLQGIAAPDVFGSIDLAGATLSMVFDEDTEFFLPPGFALSLAVSTIAPFEAFTGAPVGSTDVVTGVRLPAGTGLFDPDYAAELAALTLSHGQSPAAIQLSSPLDMILVTGFYALEGTPPGAVKQGLVRRRLALFPDNDMYVFRGGTPTNAELIPAGSIIDVVDHQAYPPTGVQRVQRIAEDLQIVSDGAMEIFFARGFSLRIDRPKFEIRQAPGGDYDYFPPTPSVINPSVVINYAIYDQFPASGVAAEVGLTLVAGQDIVSGTRAAVGRIVAPAGTFIRIPPGRPLDFLSDDLNRSPGRQFNNPRHADYSVLPEGAVMVLPPGGTLIAQALTVSVSYDPPPPAIATMTITTPLAISVSIVGPAHLRIGRGIGQNDAIALINDGSTRNSHSDPLVFLSSPARLVDSIAEDNIAESFYSEIPANARLDIKGRMEIRGDSGFHAGMLPSDTAAFLQDFPMLYAVAPECRQAVSPGRECAEGIGEGLTFELEQGEEYILSESLEAPDGVLLTTNIPGLQLVVEAMTINAAAHTTVNANAVIVQATTGLVTISGSSYVPAPHEVLLVRLASHTHPRAELRTYFGDFPGDDVSDAAYAALDGNSELTLHVGGYVGETYALAAARATLSPGAYVAFGAGGQLRGGDSGDKIFGVNSQGELDFGGYRATVDLADYVILTTDFRATLELSADSARVDVFGDLYEGMVYQAGETVDSFGVSFTVSSIDEERSARGAYQVVDGAEMEIAPGYVWQGYIPPEAELTFTENTVIAGKYTLESNKFDGLNAISVTVTVGSWPNREIQIRMQSTVAALNVWGAGVERPEAIDKFGEVTIRTPASNELPPVTIFSTYENYDYGLGTVDIIEYDGGGVATNTITRLDVTVSVATVTVAANLADHYAGFLSPTVNTSMIVDVRRGDGSFFERVTAVWDPVARIVEYDSVTTNIFVYNSGVLTQVDRVIPDLSDPIATVTVTAMLWNRKNDPFPNLDPNWEGRPETPGINFDYAVTLIDTEEIWGGRLVTALATLTSHFAIEDAHLTIGTGVLAGQAPTFNVPHFLIRGNTRHPWDVYGAYQIAYDWGGNVTLGAPTEGFGAIGMSLRASERPLYQPIDTAGAGGNVGSPATTLSNPMHGNTVMVTVNSDLTFYLDHTYSDDLPRQFISFGDGFRIPGPAALVPPFGGRSERAVRDVYAERSKLMQTVVPNAPALHTVYDDMTGDCVGSNDCGEMFNNSSWLPILLGEIAFEGVQVSVSLQHSSSDAFSEALRLVMPQPSAEVDVVGGGGGVETRRVYAGSIIYPRLGTIIPSTPLPEGNYDLILQNGPALAAVDVSPVSPLRPRALFRSRNGFLPRGAFNLPPATVTVAGDTYLVDPVGFIGEDVVDLGQVTTIANSRVTLDAAYENTASGARDTFHIEDYDGTFVRGVLLDEDGTELITSYYSGANPFMLTQFFSPGNIRTASEDGTLPIRNTDMELGDPLSFRWTHPDEHFVALGVQRDPVYGGTRVDQLVAVGFRESGVTVTTTGNEFTALRLAHRIEIPNGARMTVRGFKGDAGEIPYPSEADHFFRFPTGSEAYILNADAASWISAHPHIARYKQGLVVQLSVSATNVQTLTVGLDENDGIRRLDVSGMRVLHYHKSERNEGLPPLSSVPVYTNVWIRLPFGGILVNQDTGDVIQLQNNALLNPILGTYLTDRFDVADNSDLENNYYTEGGLSDSSSPLPVVRPALTIPAGARVVAGALGGEIKNVKAAAIFSLAPLDSVLCPSGDFDILDGQYEEGVSPPSPTEQISQIREGVSENRYFTATGQDLSLAHPCAWIDDPENMDGDRNYLYRGRRRYLDENLQARTISNDRTYLLGGKLKLNV